MSAATSRTLTHWFNVIFACCSHLKMSVMMSAATRSTTIRVPLNIPITFFSSALGSVAKLFHNYLKLFKRPCKLSKLLHEVRRWSYEWGVTLPTLRHGFWMTNGSAIYPWHTVAAFWLARDLTARNVNGDDCNCPITYLPHRTHSQSHSWGCPRGVPQVPQATWSRPGG